MCEPGPSRPRLLTPGDDASAFCCGRLSLDRFIREFAVENQKSGKSRTYVAARGSRVVAYYSLAPGSIAPSAGTSRVIAGQGHQDVPVILIARFAVDSSEQGRGLGRHLLLDALRRCVEGAEVIGGRAVLVHAHDEDARRFWFAHDFESSPVDDYHLMLLMKDVRRTLGLSI